MTAAALTPSKEYIENGVTLAYAVPFRFKAPTHIKAQRIAADGTVTELVYGSNYSVVGGETDEGGTLTVTVAGVAGTRLRIRRDTPRVQDMDYTTGDTFPAESHEGVADKAMLIDQEQDQKIQDTENRAIRVPDGESAPVLSPKAQRAGKFPLWSATGEELLDSEGTGNDPALRGDLANASLGAKLLAFAQAGIGAIVETVWDVLRRDIWVESYLVNGGVGDQTAAFAAAFAALPARGGVVKFKSDMTVGTTVPIELPVEPKVVKLRGKNAVLRQGAANKPMIKVAAGGRIMGGEITGITVIAHENSDKNDAANIAINLNGFDNGLCDVRAEGNAISTATLGRFHKVIYGHSANPFTYGNDIRLLMYLTAGPKYGVQLSDNGGGTLSNANTNRVKAQMIYVDGCDIAVDVSRTTQTTARDGWFEDCPGMEAIRCGNHTLTENNWFELVDTALNYSSDTTVANNCISRHDYLSGANKIKIHSDVVAGPEFDGTLLGGATFENQLAAPTTNYTLTGYRTSPAVPSIAFLLGAPTLALDSSSLRTLRDHHGHFVSHLTYTVTPSGTGRHVMQITPPAGYEILMASVGLEEIGAAVLPVAISSDSQARNYVWYFPNVNAHQMNIRTVIKALN